MGILLLLSVLAFITIWYIYSFFKDMCKTISDIENKKETGHE
jgi:hypothetical protein